MNLLFPLTILVLSWSIDSTDPVNQRLITYLFLTVHGLAVLCMVYVSILVWRHGGSQLLRVRNPYTGEYETKKAWEYDAAKVREVFLTKVGFSAGISFLIATRYGMPFPLILQCVNNPKAIYDSEIFRIYVLGEKAEGELQRPWAESGMVPEWVKGLWGQGAIDSEAIVDKHMGGSKKKK